MSVDQIGGDHRLQILALPAPRRPVPKLTQVIGLGDKLAGGSGPIATEAGQEKYGLFGPRVHESGDDGAVFLQCRVGRVAIDSPKGLRRILLIVEISCVRGVIIRKSKTQSLL